MKFYVDGFLSADMRTQRREILRKYSRWFSLARRLNRLCLNIVHSPREFKSQYGHADHRSVALAFFIRASSSFQSSILLAERGMTVEANTLTRSTIETAWVLAGLAKEKQDFVGKLGKSDYYQRKSAGNWYLNNKTMTATLNARQLNRLKKLIEDIAKGKKPAARLTFEEMSVLTGLIDLYAFYRHLSHHYAHPSITAVSVFASTDQNTGVKAITWEPDYGMTNLNETMAYSVMAMIVCTLAMNDVMATDGVSRAMSRLYEQYRFLATGDNTTKNSVMKKNMPFASRRSNVARDAAVAKALSK